MRANGRAETFRALLAHHEKPFRAGARHHAVEQLQRIGDRARIQILLERQRLPEQRVRKLERVVALRDAELAEVARLDAVLAHVIGGEQREAHVRPAGAERIDRVAREAAEVRQILPERVDVIGVARDARHDLGVARLHGARRAAQRHHAARAAHRDVIEPARREAEMLRQADRACRETA